jgi:peptidoglycan/LPS O-acetylase OafA/YrhL
MYNDKPLKEEKPKSLIVIGYWLLSIGFITFHVYLKPHQLLSKSCFQIYESISHIAWASAICWIVFACHRLKSGGMIRRFLSHHFWQPLSKLCLSIYLVHYIYIISTVEKVQQISNASVMIGINLSDILVSISLATVFHLLVELPAANVLELLLKVKTNHLKATCHEV